MKLVLKSKTRALCLFTFLHAWLCLSNFFFALGLDITARPDSPSVVLSLESMEKAKRAGAAAWKTLVEDREDSRSESSCWKVALDTFKLFSENCALSREPTKILLSLILVECHMRPRTHAFPVRVCRLDDLLKKDREMNESTRRAFLHDWFTTSSKSCLSALSESAFSVYIQFFNHIDNICFYLQSTVWQKRTEETVNRLTETSHHVVSQLETAQIQNDAILEQQKEALDYQKKLSYHSKRLGETLDMGHSSLKAALASMHEQVFRDQQRLAAGFQDVLALVGRIAYLQQTLSGRLADVETVLVYGALVILTYYVTAAKNTRSVRGRLYALWTLMLCLELMFWRCLTFLGLGLLDPHGSLKYCIRLWRTGCIGVGILQWFTEWWRYRDKTVVLANLLQSGLQDLKNHLENNITPRLKQKPDFTEAFGHDNEAMQDTDDQDVVLSDSLSADTSDYSSICSLASETLSLDSDYVASDQARCVTPRRNPPRAARPQAYHPPISHHDFKTLHLNPQLWFETSSDFTEAVVRQRSYTIEPRETKILWNDGTKSRMKIHINKEEKGQHENKDKSPRGEFDSHRTTRLASHRLQNPSQRDTREMIRCWPQTNNTLDPSTSLVRTQPSNDLSNRRGKKTRTSDISSSRAPRKSGKRTQQQHGGPLRI